MIDKEQVKRYGGITIGIILTISGVSVIKYFVDSFRSRFSWGDDHIVDY